MCWLYVWMNLWKVIKIDQWVFCSVLQQTLWASVSLLSVQTLVFFPSAASSHARRFGFPGFWLWCFEGGSSNVQIFGVRVGCTYLWGDCMLRPTIHFLCGGWSRRGNFWRKATFRLSLVLGLRLIVSNCKYCSCFWRSHIHVDWPVLETPFSRTSAFP